MPLSAPGTKPSNEGQTDKDRGSKGDMPVGTNMAPNGRELSVKGRVGSSGNSNSPEALHRRVPGRGIAQNGSSKG